MNERIFRQTHFFVWRYKERKIYIYHIVTLTHTHNTYPPIYSEGGGEKKTQRMNSRTWLNANSDKSPPCQKKDHFDMIGNVCKETLKLKSYNNNFSLVELHSACIFFEIKHKDLLDHLMRTMNVSEDPEDKRLIITVLDRWLKACLYLQDELPPTVQKIAKAYINNFDRENFEPEVRTVNTTLDMFNTLSTYEDRNKSRRLENMFSGAQEYLFAMSSLFMNKNPVYVAYEMTRCESFRYRSVPIVNFFRKDPSKDLDVIYLNRTSDDMSNWIQCAVVGAAVFGAAEKMVTKLLKIYEQLRIMQNFESMKQIYTAVNNVGVEKVLPKKLKIDIINEMKLVCREDNYKQYRSALKFIVDISDCPCIPIFSVLMSDVTFSSTTSKTIKKLVDGEEVLVINDSKIKTITDLASALYRSRIKDYQTTVPLTSMMGIFESIPPFSELQVKMIDLGTKVKETKMKDEDNEQAQLCCNALDMFQIKDNHKNINVLSKQLSYSKIMNSIATKANVTENQRKKLMKRQSRTSLKNSQEGPSTPISSRRQRFDIFVNNQCNRIKSGSFDNKAINNYNNSNGKENARCRRSSSFNVALFPPHLNLINLEQDALSSENLTIISTSSSCSENTSSDSQDKVMDFLRDRFGIKKEILNPNNSTAEADRPMGFNCDGYENNNYTPYIPIPLDDMIKIRTLSK